MVKEVALHQSARTDLLLVAVEGQRCDSEHMLVDTFRQLLAPRLAAHKYLTGVPSRESFLEVVDLRDCWMRD